MNAYDYWVEEKKDPKIIELEEKHSEFVDLMHPLFGTVYPIKIPKIEFGLIPYDGVIYTFRENSKIVLHESLKPEKVDYTLFHDSSHWLHYLHNPRGYAELGIFEENKFLREIIAEYSTISYLHLSEGEDEISRYLQVYENDHLAQVSHDIFRGSKDLLPVLLKQKSIEEARTHFERFLKRDLYEE